MVYDYKTTPRAATYRAIDLMSLVRDADQAYDSRPLDRKYSPYSAEISAAISSRNLMDDHEAGILADLLDYLHMHNYKVEFYPYSDVQNLGLKIHNRMTLDSKTSVSDKHQYTRKHDRLRRKIPKSCLAPSLTCPRGDRSNADDPARRVILLRDSANHPSQIWKDFDPHDKNWGKPPQPAQLEVRGILLSYSRSRDCWFVNVIKKGGWYELPGGSFNPMPTTEQGLLDTAARKFNSEVFHRQVLRSTDLTLLEDASWTVEPEGSNYISDLCAGTSLEYQITADWMFIGEVNLPDANLSMSSHDTSADIKKNNDGESIWQD